MWSKVLVVVGLVLEFLSVAWTVKKVFWDISKHLKRILGKETGKYQVTEEINKLRDGRIIIILLSIGMFLQALAVFIDF